MYETDEAKLERVRQGLVMRLSGALQEHEATIRWTYHERGTLLYDFVLKPCGASALHVGLGAAGMQHPTQDLVRQIGDQFRDYLKTLESHA